VRIDWAVACRYVEVSGGTATIVGAGIDTYTLQSFPADLQVNMAVRIAAQDDELGSEHQHAFGVKVLDPAMEPISELRTPFTSEANPLKRPGWEGGMILPVVQVFRPEAPGVYTIELSVDGRAYPFSIIVNEADAEPPPAE
jgi:hypothetical protein